MITLAKMGESYEYIAKQKKASHREIYAVWLYLNKVQKRQN